MRVLTSISCIQSKCWHDNTTLMSRWCEAAVGNEDTSYLSRHLLAIIIAIKVMLIRHKYDVIVVDGGPVGNWVSWLQSIFVIGRKPTIMTQCLWNIPSSPRHFVKRILHRISACSVNRFVVWAKHEIDDFSETFGIPKYKFHFLPYHSTVKGYRYEINDDGYVFAGGNSDRDYKTLIEAVRGLNIPVFIASSDRRLFHGIDIPANVRIEKVSPDEFRQKMASSTITVLPIKKGLLRSPGQQTILNAMAMGKPTIVVGRKDAEDYLEHGRTGIIVDYEDVDSLRKAISGLYHDKAGRDMIAGNAIAYASDMTQEEYYKSIYEMASKLSLR